MLPDSKQETRKRVLRQSFRDDMENIDESTLLIPLSKQLERYKKHMEEEKKWKK